MYDVARIGQEWHVIYQGTYVKQDLVYRTKEEYPCWKLYVSSFDYETCREIADLKNKEIDDRAELEHV